MRIVESTSPLWQSGAAWHLGPQPNVEIGGGALEHEQLFRVAGAIRLTDGTIVVANSGTSQLRYFDQAGGYLGAGGREGAGPGEFGAGRGPAHVWRLPNDSVATWGYYGNRRLSVFDHRGTYARSITLRPKAGAFPEVIGLLSNNRLVTRDGAFADQNHPIGTIFRATFTYDLYDSAGAWVESIATLPGFERLVYEWNGRTVSGSGPFGRLAWAFVADNQLYYTDAEHFEIWRIDLATDAQQIARILQEPTPVRSEDISAFKVERMADAPDDPSGRQAWATWLDDVTYPRVFPTFKGLLGDAVGNAWAEEYTIPTDSVPKWRVFGRDGRWLGTVTMPTDFVVHDIGDSYVLGEWHDADGVEYVRLYDLIKPTGS